MHSEMYQKMLDEARDVLTLVAEVERLRRMELHYEQHAVNAYDDFLREEASRARA